MTDNRLTLIDAFNQFWIVVEDTGTQSLNQAGFTYFYFVKIWNGCGRPCNFRRQNNLICAELNISRPTLDRHRQILQEAGLIAFCSAGKGDHSISYSINHRMHHKMEREKENNFTSPDVTHDVKKESLMVVDVTSPITSPDTYKQSKSKEKEKEILVVVSGEKKTFNFFIDFFLSDAGLKASFSKLELPQDFFSEALEQWMIRNHEKEYANLQEARKHFLFWLPFYKTQKEKNYETKSLYTKQKNSNSGSRPDLGYAGGL